TVTADAQTQVNGGASVVLSFDSGCPGPQCWSTAQTVTVTAIDDSIAEGAHNGTITHSAASGDASYNGIGIGNVTMSITDNDSAGITLTESGGTTTNTEGGATDTYTLVLTSEPTNPVTITINADAQTQVNAMASDNLVFNSTCPGAQCWSTAQTVTVSSVDDSIAEGNHNGTITHSVASGDGNYNTYALANVSVSITDNDSAGVTVTESGGTTTATEGGANDSYTVVLTSEPTAAVTITVNADAQTQVNGGSSDTLTFNSTCPGANCWSTAQTVTVTAVDDSIAEGGHNSTITHSASSGDANYNGIGIASVTTALTDNDSAGVTVTESGGNTAVTEGTGNDSFTVVLTSEPTGAVTITVSADTQTQVNGGSSANLTFNSTCPGANCWSTAQTITVTAVADSVFEPAHNGTITHSASSGDTNYNGIGIASVTAVITDEGHGKNNIETVTGSTSFFNSIAVDPGNVNNVYVSYYDQSTGNLKAARSTNSGATWTTQTVDSSATVGHYNSIEVNGTNVYISYQDFTNRDLKLAKSTDSGVTFTPQTVIGGAGDDGAHSSLAVDGPNLFITYQDNSTGDLRFIRSATAGAGWMGSVLIDNAGQMTASSIDSIPGGTIFVSYFDNTANAWKFAKSTDFGATWPMIRTVDTGGNFPNPTSIQGGPQIHFCYYDDVNLDLKLATSTDGGNTWGTQTVDSGGDVGDDCSLARNGPNLY
ncbi:MAG: hypothetical protein KDK27_15810, partial [Leptospiraceae bacterium]|nr:hypothetical protein [Leptospiraceae bacterium]